MKRSTLALLTSALFVLSGCVFAGPDTNSQAAAPVSAVPDATLKDLSDAGLEYFDRDLPNRDAHRAAWHLQDKRS